MCVFFNDNIAERWLMICDDIYNYSALTVWAGIQYIEIALATFSQKVEYHGIRS